MDIIIEKLNEPQFGLISKYTTKVYSRDSMKTLTTFLISILFRHSSQASNLVGFIPPNEKAAESDMIIPNP